METDKIGCGAFFWALPSMGLQTRKNTIEDYDKKIEAAKKDQETKTARLEEETKARDDLGGERQKMIEELEALKAKRSKLTAELKNYERSDPK